MKKLMAILMVVLLMGVGSACSQDEGNNPQGLPPEETTHEVVQDTTTDAAPEVQYDNDGAIQYESVDVHEYQVLPATGGPG